jgi:hypothetical protein
MRTLSRGLAGLSVAALANAPMAAAAEEAQAPAGVVDATTLSPEQKRETVERAIARADEILKSVTTARANAVAANDTAWRDCIDLILPEMTTLRSLMGIAQTALSGFLASGQGDLAAQEVTKATVALGQLETKGANAAACAGARDTSGALIQVEVTEEPTPIDSLSSPEPVGPSPITVATTPPPT